MTARLPGVGKNKHLCVHGHFYQPPRANPWTGSVDPEASARPHRDWNSRILQECYGPNAAAPLSGEDGRIVDMADNYEKISFNFGPTLLSWMEREDPRLYTSILRADARSVRARRHGNAIAQPYIHAILPLQTPDDQRALVRWGLEDFKRRFGRESEGIWLPETGVDEQTLEILVEFGLRFTILHPRQAARVRPAGGGSTEWTEVDERTLIPTRPYRWLSKKRPGKGLALFFFHQGLHDSVVSGDAFSSPDTLFKKIAARTHPNDSTQLIHIASDGEFFGHHHRSGATALTRTLFLAEQAGFAIVNPAQFLEMFPPPQEVEIRPRTAWSCAHGLGRWTADCGCRSPRLKSWSQAWRGPLREALNWLAEELDKVYAARAERHGEPALLEMQRQRLAMFTSCGWFFDEVSGIETAQILKHAARAVSIAETLGVELTPEFKRRLSVCPSNVSAFKDGAGVYEKLVLPCRADARRIAAHWAILEHLRPGLGSAPPDWRLETGEPSRASKQGPAGRDRFLSARLLSATQLSTRQSRVFTAVVHQRDRLDVACRLGPAGFDTSGLVDAFGREDDNAFERSLNAALGADFLTLEALLPAERTETLRWLAPDPGGGKKRKDFLDRWVAEMADGVGEACPELLAEAAELGLPADRLPWAGRARRRLRETLESLLDGADAAALSRAGRWLDAFEQGGLAADRWELQYLFWRWRARLAERPASPAERRLAAAFGEKLGFADSVLPLEAPV